MNIEMNIEDGRGSIYRTLEKHCPRPGAALDSGHRAYKQNAPPVCKLNGEPSTAPQTLAAGSQAEFTLGKQASLAREKT